MPVDGTEPEEVAQDFDDDALGNFVGPVIGDDDQQSMKSRQTVNTFNYAADKKPPFLQGVPSDVPTR